MNPLPEPLPGTAPQVTAKAKTREPKRKFLPLSPRVLDRRARKRTRLPHGSQFSTHFDATTDRHTGSLRIPLGGTEWMWFQATAHGLFRLLENLDDQYRAWLVRHTTTAAAAPDTQPSTGEEVRHA